MTASDAEVKLLVALGGGELHSALPYSDPELLQQGRYDNPACVLSVFQTSLMTREFWVFADGLCWYRLKPSSSRERSSSACGTACRSPLASGFTTASAHTNCCPTSNCRQCKSAARDTSHIARPSAHRCPARLWTAVSLAHRRLPRAPLAPSPLQPRWTCHQLLPLRRLGVQRCRARDHETVETDAVSDAHSRSCTRLVVVMSTFGLAFLVIST